MERRLQVFLFLASGALLAAGTLALAVELFFPEASDRVDEALPTAEGETMIVLKQGGFVGRAGHDVSGGARILLVGDEAYLRFEDYDQTPGPDVFVYLTPAIEPDSEEEVRAGTRILLDGGADGGESTKTGNFNQRLPPGLDLEGIRGVAIWCDRYNVPFGFATLNEPR